MNDSDLSREVVSRVLQVTQASWAQELPAPLPVKVFSSPRLSSHRAAGQRLAPNTRLSWGLQPVWRSVAPLRG
jgi:hypothetical protein